MVNGVAVRRSPAGYFAPTVDLQFGENNIVVSRGEDHVSIRVTRLPPFDMPSGEAAIVPGSLYPDASETLMPGELAVFRLSALPGADVEVGLGDRSILLQPKLSSAPVAGSDDSSKPVVYEGSMALPPSPPSGEIQYLGEPTFRISRNGSSACYPGSGGISVLSPERRDTVEITANRCAARTGPSEDDARIITIPKGARSGVSGVFGDWYRLDCGYWIFKSDAVDLGPGAIVPPRLGDIIATNGSDRTSIRFYLSSPATIGAFQEMGKLSLTFYGVETRTELFRFRPDRLVKSALWTESSPGNAVFSFDMATGQQWGYALRYEGSTLVLELFAPPPHRGLCIFDTHPLEGMSFVLDPGHGGSDGGAIGPNGAHEKDLNLAFALTLRDELRKRGAEVFMTRETDFFVSLSDRVDFIEAHRPSLALSLHHNSLPDGERPEDISGMGAFWFNAQAQEAASFLFERFVDKCKVDPYGVYWDNLALPRTTGAPTLLLELGFMSNPWEFEQLINTQERAKRARALAEAIVEWSRKVRH